MKKVVLFIVFLAFIFGLAACNREIDDTLDSPQNLSITDGIVSWDAVADADHYIVYVNQDQNEAQTTTFDLNTLDLAEGTYAVTVVAVRDDKISLPSSALSFVVEGETNDTISAPTNVTLTNDVLSWDAVDGATGYVVHVGAMTFNVSTTSIDLSSESIPEGTFSVYVEAVKNTLVSAASQTLSYTVETNVSQDEIKISVLQIIDTTYDLDLEEDDFVSFEEYNDYLRALNSAEAYAAASIELGMSSTQAISFFGDAKEMVLGMDDITSMDDFMNELSLLDDYDMSAADLAIVVYKLLDVMIDADIRSMNFIIEDNETYIPQVITDIAEAKSEQVYIDAYNFMKSYATVDEYDAIDALFSGEYESLMSAVYDIQYMLVGMGYPVYGYDYTWDKDLDTSYVDDLVIVMTAMMEDVPGSDFVNNIYSELSFLQMLINDVMWLEGLNNTNEEYNNQIDMLGGVKTSIDENEEEIIESLEVFFDFLFTVRDTIPQNMIDLVDDMMMGDELTMTEMFIIKDELVLVLQGALPSASDFELVFETMITITGAAVDMDVQAYLDYSNLMALTSHASIDLLLTLFGDIDEALVTSGMTILEDAQDEFGDYDFENNPKVAIDFVLYVIDYLEAFTQENQTKVDALTTLYTEEIIEDFYVMILDAAIVQIENDIYIDPLEKTIMIDLFEDLKLEFDTYYALYNLFEDGASDVLTYMIDTQARLLKTIIDLSNQEEPDLSIILPNIELVIEDVHMIDVELFDEITIVDLDVIFEAAKIPLSAMLSIQEPDFPFDTLYLELSPHLKTIILNIIDLQTDLMIQADALDLVSIVLNPNISSEDIGIAYALVTALNLTLTTANEAMIFNSIDLVFDSILGNTTVLDLMGSTALEIDQRQDDIVLDVESMIDEIQALALLDINSLTVDDENRLLDFMMALGFFTPEEEPALN